MPVETALSTVRSIALHILVVFFGLHQADNWTGLDAGSRRTDHHKDSQSHLLLFASFGYRLFIAIPIAIEIIPST